MVKVVDSTGVVVQYVYDAVDDLTQITRSTAAPGTLTIFNITPLTTGSGGTITIQGQGFSPTASLDMVSIGGVAATVISATSTILVAGVPASAVSGPIVVTVGATTVTSSSNEIVVPTPIISSVHPRGMQAGTTVSVTVTGANLAGCVFSFEVGSGLAVAAATINGTGTSATLTVVAGPTAHGQFAVIATNNGGVNSGLGPTAANSFGAFTDPNADAPPTTG